MEIPVRFGLVMVPLLLALPMELFGQDHVHTPGMAMPGSGAVPVEGGQSAFAALAEVVRILEADPKTDWSKVRMEDLRQHLADMDEVTLRSQVIARAIPGGAVFEVSGTGRTFEAIQRMVLAHAPTLAADPRFEAQAVRTPTGARLTVTAKAESDRAQLELRIRGLGFAGLMTLGAHHQVHHLGIARGEMVHQH